jgi:hypothetical protein
MNAAIPATTITAPAKTWRIVATLPGLDRGFGRPWRG